ncbi:hypothetical protein N8571_02330, partial [Akkermansiaceae bacterium]|nr:hypothetical protein [Akkermansiaceae bacterium]
FQPDWVWVKKRSTAGDHKLIDSTRGVGQVLESNTTDTEADESSSFTAFGADGFSLAGTAGAWNENANNYVAWNWKANGGTTSSNTDGSITSTVQASTTSGFSIVTYTGAGSAGTVGHGLGAVPKWLIVRNRTEAYNWKVYHAGNTSAPETDYLVLDNTDVTADNVTHWADTAPTSTVFSLGTSNALIKNTNTFVAYCFAEVEGYSKFGSYTGNGNANGTFVFTGFRPAWVMVKRTDSADHWNILDVKRDTFNVMDTRLLANNSTGEQTSSSYYVDFTSNGFKLRTSDSGWNGSGASYIYMAFADGQPFKYANGR